MEQLAQFRATLATYRKHGWQLRRVLMRPDTLAALQQTNGDEASATPRFEDVGVQPAAFDAMWLARPSHAGREAWELRLIAEPPYALFELFEPDEAEEDRADVRREMEARLREMVSGEGEPAHDE
ncbi:MAG TPA: hypothetical protein VF525_05480 [Pyrinomonadaceae bacterium]|jgi:hypothetical protein